MKKIRKIVGLLCIMLFACVVNTQNVGAAQSDYVYDAATNSYTLQVKSGANITDALTSALDAAVGTEGNPAQIVIPSGSYSINLVKVTKSYVTISAEGATIKFAGSTSSGQFVLKATDASTTGVKISGGTWDGNSKASVIFQFGGDSVTTNNLTIENCTVKNADQNVKVNKGNNITFSKVTFANANYGISVSNTKNLTMTGCSATDNTFGYGLRTLSGTNTLENCTATANSTDGLQIKEKGTSVTIKGGSYNNNTKNGISMTAGTTVTMNGVDVSNNKSNGISPVGSTSSKTVLIAANCKFNKNGRHGVAGDSGATINVTDSEANNNTANGIMLNKKCTSTGIAGCTTNGNGGTGILIQDGSSCSSVKNCTSNNNKNIGITLTDVTTTVENCTVNNNQKHGINIANKAGYNAAKKVTIKNTQCNGNKSVGITITDKKTVVVTDSEASNNSSSGIETKGASLTIRGSTFSGNGKYGIVARAGKLNINKATVSKNKSEGIYYTGTNVSGYCTNSKIVGNKVGISLYQGITISKLNGNTISNSKQYGMLCGGEKGHKAVIKQCKNNKFSNPNAKAEISCYGKVTLPSTVKAQKPVTFGKKVKAGAKTVTGTATAGQTIKVTVGKKNYTVKVNGGKFTVKSGKLKRGTKIKAVIIDKSKNTFTASCTVK